MTILRFAPALVFALSAPASAASIPAKERIVVLVSIDGFPAWLCFVYVTDPARRAELLPKLRTLCAGIEGVKQVIEGNDGPVLGMPTPVENQAMGDLVLYARDGYAFTQGVTGGVISDSPDYQGSHGYPNSDPDLDGIFLASGYGIQRGVTIPRVTNLDVAPTLAELLGVKLSQPEGRVLTEILAK